MALLILHQKAGMSKLVIRLSRRMFTTEKEDTAALLEGYHASQTGTLGDKLILVDREDREVGVLDKKTCHLNSYNRNGGLPHRAFSLFMFNGSNQLLLHRRSKLKIAFPMAWTNSVCSHPEVKEPAAGKYQYEAPAKAVVRRTLFELGVDIAKFQLHAVDKILYQSEYDSRWGEHELDHVFICRVDQELQELIKPNPDEISQLKWVSKEELEPFMKGIVEEGGYFSPWFDKIRKNKLANWWNLLEQGNSAALANIKLPQQLQYL